MRPPIPPPDVYSDSAPGSLRPDGTLMMEEACSFTTLSACVTAHVFPHLLRLKDGVYTALRRKQEVQPVVAPHGHEESDNIDLMDHEQGTEHIRSWYSKRLC
jgi:hypothetical protein